MITITESEGVVSDQDERIKVLNCTDVPRMHWLVKNENWAAALNVNQSDNRPAIYIRDNRVFLGVEQGIFILDVESGKLVNEVSDVSFVQWIEEDVPTCVIFSAEDEVITIGNNGQLLWRKGMPDIIKTMDIVNGRLVINDMSGGQYSYNVKDGSAA